MISGANGHLACEESEGITTALENCRALGVKVGDAIIHTDDALPLIINGKNVIMVKHEKIIGVIR